MRECADEGMLETEERNRSSGYHCLEQYGSQATGWRRKTATSLPELALLCRSVCRTPTVMLAGLSRHSSQASLEVQNPIAKPRADAPSGDGDVTGEVT